MPPLARRALAGAASAFVALSALVLAALAADTSGLLPTNLTASSAATAAVPAGFLSIYNSEAGWCPGLAWTVLAAVGTIESGNGRNDGPSAAGAVGPMQFEPATFARYALPIPAGGAVPPSPVDPTDAVAAAARYLCALGAVDDPHDALVGYNCGNTGPACQAASAGYAAEVLDLANRYGTTASGASTTAGVTAVAYASSQIGVAYRWGGEAPGGGFDCSGLVQWAFAQAGVVLPRTAQTQFDAGPPLPADTAPAAGDLLFFGTGTTSIIHVGIYTGGEMMIDAPHTGAVVREEPVPTRIGARWGGDRLVGITTP